MQEGRISRDMPAIKARARRDHRQGVVAARADGRAGSEVREDHRRGAAQGRGEARRARRPRTSSRRRCWTILKLSEFEAKDLTWKSFPNHAGHSETPGCFRCHDGKHFNDKGEAIRLQCTLCHDIPQVSIDGTKKTVASTVSEGLEPPSSHEAPNWMREHREKLDDSCKMCHGPIKFGNDGGSVLLQPGVSRAQMAEHQPRRRSAEEGRPRCAVAGPGGNRWRTRRAVGPAGEPQKTTPPGVNRAAFASAASP